MEEVPQSSLAAIVFTDIVGFSRMMSEDESNALPRAKAELTRLRGLCEGYNGKVLKSTGDGLLMHFTSAVQAVACALEIQKTPPTAGDRPLQHRIGIHLGDVYLGDGDVMGDGVNIAARLQTQADPGGICISKTVYDVVKNRLAIQATFLGPRELKNISEAVPIYKILIEAQGSGNLVRLGPEKKSSASYLPLIVIGIGALLAFGIWLGIDLGKSKSAAPPTVSSSASKTVTATATPEPLSPAETRVSGAWISAQHSTIIIYLPDRRLGISLAFGDRKMLGIVGTWHADDHSITVVRTDPAKTSVSTIVNMTDSQLILKGEMGVRFLERIPTPDLPTVVVSGLSANSTKDLNRPQIAPIAIAVPADQSYNLGVTAFNNGDYDQAITKFTEALALKPDFYQALFHRAHSYELSNAFDKALADFNQLITVRPKDAFYYNDRAVVEIKSGNDTAAIDDENTALGLKPGFVNALVSRGQAHTLLGQYPEAIADCDAALALNPNDAFAYMNRGIAKKASGDVTGGQADLDQAATLFDTSQSKPDASVPGQSPVPVPTH